MISTIVSRLVILVFGTLYPAYASYKAVRTKNVKEYVKWMMYWIVFALFTCAETFTDVFLSWFPFYYEIKIILVLWLLSPATKGSSILYRKFVHPMLSRREQEIDEYISKAKEQGYHTVLNLGTKGVNYATTVIMQTALKGGGGIVNQLRKSYSLSDLTHDADARADTRGLQESADEAGDVIDARLVRRRHSPRRSASGSSRVEMYFPEVDVRPGPLSHVRSTEDVSSGYSSAEPLYVGQPLKLEPREALGLVRTASVGGSSRPRIRSTRASVATKKTVLPEDSECSEESETDSEPSTSTVRYIPKKSLTTSVTNAETDSSENSEFEDTIGFPAEQKPIKIKTVEASQSPVQQIVETVCDIQIIEIAQPHIVENISQIIEVAQVEKIIGDIIEIKNDVTVTQTERVDNLEDGVETVCNVKLQIKEPSLEIYEDSIQEITKDTETIKDPTEELLMGSDKADIDNIVGSIYEDVELNKKSEIGNLIEDNCDYETISLCSISQRGGKYNKHTAPIPPSQIEKLTTSTEEIESNIIIKDTSSITLTTIENIDKLESKIEACEALESEFEDASSEILKIDDASGNPKKEDGDLVPSVELNSDVQTQEEIVSEVSIKQIPNIASDESKNISATSEPISLDAQTQEASSSETSINQNQSNKQLMIKTNEQKQPSKKLETTSHEKLNKLEQELDKSEPESLPIKATLILKPGVIKSLSSSEDSNKTEVFVSHSSKPKQKSKSKHESPISRLMMLPKKFFGYKEHGHSSHENLNAEKRKSWHDDSRSSTPISQYSKSDTEGSREQLNKDNQKGIDSKLVVRTLSHSPKQYRRKTRDVERYEDSD